MIINGDCLLEMRKMDDNSIDFIICDPPYALNFMNKDWDNEIPTVEVWKEALRICKPGSWLAAFGGTRTYHRLTCCIEDAGWTIRDCIMWIYGSGFPKGKGCLKPAWEPIILARKNGPNPKLNIDECRIPTNDNTGRPKGPVGNCFGHFNQITTETHPKGRWPANLILDEEAGQMLDQMTGKLLGAGNKIGSQKKQNSMFVNDQSQINMKYDNGGFPSRFFYCAKSSSRERNEGLDKPSSHPTVKPLSLMRYIIKLLSPPGDPILLDPFAGSGSTCIASLQLGIKSIGIEKNAEYCEIARKRLEYHGQAHKKNKEREQRCHQETFQFGEDG